MEDKYGPRRNRRRRRSLIALLMAGTALISATGATMSMALFTSTPVALSANFTAGTIILTTTPTPVLFNVTAMMPGDSVSAVLTVKNAGTGALRYAMTSTFTQTLGLADQMDLVISPTTTDCTTGVGAAIFTGKLSGAKFGDPTQGAQAGDRPLAAGVTELLCFKASLDKVTTTNSFQGGTASSTLTFNAEQTANN